MKQVLTYISDTRVDLCDNTANQRMIYNNPAGTSIKNLKLWGQNYRNSNMGTYNYGDDENMKR